jgi:hypothetical protein
MGRYALFPLLKRLSRYKHIYNMIINSEMAIAASSAFGFKHRRFKFFTMGKEV